MAKYSHAQNECCIAQNIGSHAGGNHTVTSRAYQTAIGEYNADNTSALLIVGNGSDTKRSNALELDKDGNTKIAGSLTLNMNRTPVTITASQLTKLLVGDKYELIEEIDITEDTNSIVRTAEPDGTAYNFSRLKIKVTTISDSSISSDSPVFCYISFGNTKMQLRHENGVSKTLNSFILFGDIYDNNGYWDVMPTRFQNYSDNSMRIATFPSCAYDKILSIPSTVKISKIEIQAYNEGVNFKAGTKIQIYGVRA